MIEIYGGNSPNVIKVLIALEEMGLAYVRVPLDVLRGEQHSPEFLAISPNNRIPAMVDRDPPDGGDPVSVFESGAILLYLADRAHMLLPSDFRGRSEVTAWLMWQMAGQGPMFGQLNYFRNYAPEKTAYAIARYAKEAERLYRVMDTRLAGREFLAGEYSIADIACWPWIFFRSQHGAAIEQFPHVVRWYEGMAARPALIRALAGFEAPAPSNLDGIARKSLYAGQ